jgi:hypothetical protein
MVQRFVYLDFRNEFRKIIVAVRLENKTTGFAAMLQRATLDNGNVA